MTTEKDYTIIVSDAKTGKRIGRLAPDGTAAIHIVFAARFDKEQAEQIAAEINAGDEYTAKIRRL